MSHSASWEEGLILLIYFSLRLTIALKILGFIDDCLCLLVCTKFVDSGSVTGIFG
jgi:hypothetical protein